jgi:hypothetical protein
MIATNALALAEQRLALQQQLLEQRQVIAQQLDQAGTPGYPRSNTMRFLQRTNMPASTAIRGVVTLLGGLRIYKTIAGAMSLIGAVRGKRSN